MKKGGPGCEGPPCKTTGTALLPSEKTGCREAAGRQAFFAGAFLAAGFFAAGFLAAGFFAAGFFAATFLAAGFLAAGFFAAVLVAIWTPKVDVHMHDAKYKNAPTLHASITRAFGLRAVVSTHGACAESHRGDVCGRATSSDRPAFQPDGKRDGLSRPSGIDAFLSDDFVAAFAAVAIIDGNQLWSLRGPQPRHRFRMVGE
jgi:hypothetical protein